MKKNILGLLSILLIIGALVVSAYIYLSFFEVEFLKQALVAWTIVVIAVLGAFIFEVYDSSMER